MKGLDIHFDVAFGLCKWFKPESSGIDSSSKIGDLDLGVFRHSLVDPLLKMIVDKLSSRWRESKVYVLKKVSTKRSIDESADLLSSLSNEVLRQMVIEQPVFPLGL